MSVSMTRERLEGQVKASKRVHWTKSITKRKNEIPNTQENLNKINSHLQVNMIHDDYLY